MTTYGRDDLRARVQRIVRDATTGDSTTLINDYLDDIIKDLGARAEFPDMLDEVEHSTGGAAFVDFSVIAPTLRIPNIITLRDTTNGIIIPIVDSNEFDRTQPDQTGSGYPSYAYPRNESSLYIYPNGSTSTWKVKYQKQHADFSADSIDLEYPEVAAKVVVDGVCAEFLDYLDDERADKYLGKYERGIRKLRAMNLNQYNDSTMQHGTGNRISNQDWMLG